MKYDILMLYITVLRFATAVRYDGGSLLIQPELRHNLDYLFETYLKYGKWRRKA
jgi:hypothetical protein